MRRSLTMGSLTALLALCAGACGDDGAPSSSPPPADAGNQVNNSACRDRLTADATNISVEAGLTADVIVRLSKCTGEPAFGDIAFELLGETGGASLSGPSYPADASGMARNLLTAGPSEAIFQIRASATDAEPILINVEVTADPAGALTVNLEYDGQLAFETFRAFLYVASCATYSEWTEEAADYSAPAVANIDDAIRFADLPARPDYAVFVRAESGGALRGWGCADVVVEDDRERVVTVTLMDVPPSFDGVFLLDNVLDFSESRPPSIGRVVDIVNEATDDNDLENDDPGDGQYGQDPAAFVLDFLFREVCCWEATGQTPNWDSCRDQETTHPYGDLSALYQHDFSQWEGAQSLQTGLCTGVWASNVFLQGLLQETIEENAPDIVLHLLDMARDVTDTLEHLSAVSRLTISDLEVTKEGNFTHELVSVHVEIHDLAGEPHAYDVLLADAGITSASYTGPTTVRSTTLTIPEHTIAIDLGVLMRYIYTQAVLPELGFTSTVEMLAHFVDCAELAVWVEDQIGILDVDDYEGYCMDGIEAAADKIEDTIDDLSETPTRFTLEGHAEAGGIGDDRVVNSLVGGVWAGEWSERGESGEFPGTFSGVRQE